MPIPTHNAMWEELEISSKSLHQIGHFIYIGERPDNRVKYCAMLLPPQTLKRATGFLPNLKGRDNIGNNNDFWGFYRVEKAHQDTNCTRLQIRHFHCR